MVAPKGLPALAILLDKFTYDPETGLLKHNKHYGPLIRKGSIAGSLRKDGYSQVKVCSKNYLVHRVCYYMHTGEMPEYVDHINRIRGDNRIVNLRSGTHHDNMLNKSEYSNNNTGERNISFHQRDGVYEVKFKVNGKQIYVGRSKSLAEAVVIRDSWAETH